MLDAQQLETAGFGGKTALRREARNFSCRICSIDKPQEGGFIVGARGSQVLGPGTFTAVSCAGFLSALVLEYMGGSGKSEGLWGTRRRS